MSNILARAVVSVMEAESAKGRVRPIEWLSEMTVPSPKTFVSVWLKARSVAPELSDKLLLNTKTLVSPKVAASDLTSPTLNIAVSAVDKELVKYLVTPKTGTSTSGEGIRKVFKY